MNFAMIVKPEIIAPYCVARNLKETGNMLSVNKKICEKAYWYKSVVEEGNKYAVKKKTIIREKGFY